MVKDTEDKKGFWNTWLGKTVSFVGKYTGISWILGKISSGWNTVKSWFSSNGATKANADNSPKDQTPNNDRKVSAEGQGRTAQVQNPDQEDEVDSVGNGLSTTDPLAAGGPAEPTPSNGTSATPLSGPAGPATGGESDMQETKQNPVQPDSMPVGGMGATSQQGFKAFIKIDGENLKFVSMTADTTAYMLKISLYKH